MLNPLLDEEFLLNLENKTHREIFARITALNMAELPIETIEGRVTGGSINIDGNSAVRRTCNLTMVAKDININNFYWGLNTKIKLEIGLTNDIDDKYSNIIWFPQGIFVITTFNTSHTTNNYQITLNGKDKMCLLNGDLGGALPASINFSEIDNYDIETLTTTTELIPIKTIIREAVHTYGKEPYHNIIINDVEDYGVELLEYRGEEPIYFFRPIEDNAYTNMTVYGNTKVFVEGSNQVSELKDIQCLNLVDTALINQPTVISLAKKNKYDNYIPTVQKYYVAKVEQGQTAGYRKTPLTWPSDTPLTAAIGESLTSILDKINKKFYSNYEYFYDLEGHFVFQKKKNYISTTWNPIKNNGDGIYIDNSTKNDVSIYEFNNSNLIVSFTNTPNLQNLRNDFSIWGVRESVTGAEIPIHLRYAIDNKPIYYKTYNGKEYNTDNYDWREIIYQMACDYYENNQKDDFLYKIAQNNLDYYPSGYTGYEQYYIDIQGFWRQIYCYGVKETKEENYKPNPKYEYYGINDKGKYELKSYLIHWLSTEDIPDLYIKRLTDDGKEVVDSKGRPMYKKAQTPVSKDSDRCEYRNDIKYGHIKFDNMETYYIINSNYDENDVESEQYILFEKPKENENNIYEYIFYSNEIYYRNVEKIGYYMDVKGSPISIDLTNFDPETGWNYSVIDSPENLNFWFDFLDQTGELDNFQVQAVGDRTKVINDNSITALYFRETPTVLFVQNEEEKQDTMGYTWIQLPKNIDINNIFTISSQKKSAQEQLDNLLYNYSYCIENTTINAIPIYRLEPNRIIVVKDEKSKVNGQYIISKITIPLAYNGTMTINATKAVERLY